MATLAHAGRIGEKGVDEEIARLNRRWRALDSASQSSILEDLLGPSAQRLDAFDRYQLEGVVKLCRESKTLSDAGRKLFAVSRLEKASSNDADRLKKYLARFGLTFDQVAS
jgi:transcriptional regulatory protein RtcR